MEVQREVTSLCDASKSTGQELHIEVCWIINKVACGFCAAAGKWEKVNTSAHSTVVNGALSQHWLKAAKIPWPNKVNLIENYCPFSAMDFY